MPIFNDFTIEIFLENYLRSFYTYTPYLLVNGESGRTDRYGYVERTLKLIPFEKGHAKGSFPLVQTNYQH